jgi:hypothetical protein
VRNTGSAPAKAPTRRFPAPGSVGGMAATLEEPLLRRFEWNMGSHSGWCSWRLCCSLTVPHHTVDIYTTASYYTVRVYNGI